MRKQILKFDDILNDQRQIIYKNRKDILVTKDQSTILKEMIDDYINNLIIECIPANKYSSEWDAKLLKEKTNEVFDLNLPIEEWFEEEGVDEEEIKNRIYDLVNQKYNEKI